MRCGVAERGLCGCAGFVQGVATLRLVGQLIGCGNILADELFQLVFSRGKVSLFGHFPWVFGGLFGQFDDGFDNFFTGVMREQYGAEHDFFRQLIGFGFDHHHCVIGCGNDQIEVAFGNLFVGRVQDILAVQITNARGADGAHERNAADGHCSRGSHQREDIRLILAIIGHDMRDTVDLVIETLRKQRPHRPVNQARNQRFLFGRSAFTLEKATGNTTGR